MYIKYANKSKLTLGHRIQVGVECSNGQLLNARGTYIRSVVAVSSFMAGIRNVYVVITVLCYCTVSSAFNISTVIDCLVRQYTFKASNPFTTEDGIVLPCEDYVTVLSCWGRCDSNYKIPYKISNHPVCTYGGKKSRVVTLRKCHPYHPDPTFTVFDATHCYNSTFTNRKITF
ncbi:hypothetical protein KUTeg_014282, partial [Tegillarca granosa]